MTKLIDNSDEIFDNAYMLSFLTNRTIEDLGWMAVTHLDKKCEKHFDYWRSIINRSFTFLQELLRSPYFLYFVYFNYTVDDTTIVTELEKQGIYDLDTYNLVDFVIDRAIFLIKKDFLILRKNTCITKVFT